MTALYNEIDPKAAAWLRELIKRGLIAPGVVIEASIEDLTPNDIKPFTQFHAFAGIGIWSLALRRAGISDDTPVWSMSCPCQPFSAAGKGGGFDDERHLWPSAHWLVAQCRPELIFGEQVASKDAEPWLDLVQADLEGLDYAFGACAFPSAGVGAPHIRDRSYWVADTMRDGTRSRPGRRDSTQGAVVEVDWRVSRPGSAAGFSGASGGLADDDAGLEGRRQPGRERGNELAAGPGGLAGGLADAQGIGAGRQSRSLLGASGSGEREVAGQGHGDAVGADGATGGLADADGRKRDGQSIFRGLERDGQDAGRAQGSGEPGARRVDSGLADAASSGRGKERADAGGQPVGDNSEGLAAGLEHGVGSHRLGRHALPHGAGAQGEHGLREVATHAGPVNGGWSDADWIYCRNGEWRPVKPGSFPLANGYPQRVGLLRGAGNAINAEAATVFIEAYLEAQDAEADQHLRLIEAPAGDIFS